MDRELIHYLAFIQGGQSCLFATNTMKANKQLKETSVWKIYKPILLMCATIAVLVQFLYKAKQWVRSNV